MTPHYNLVVRRDADNMNLNYLHDDNTPKNFQEDRYRSAYQAHRNQFFYHPNQPTERFPKKSFAGY